MHAKSVAVLALAGAAAAVAAQQAPKDELMDALARTEALEFGRAGDEETKEILLEETLEEENREEEPVVVPELQAGHHQLQNSNTNVNGGCNKCGCKEPGCCACPTHTPKPPCPPKPTSKTKVTHTHTVTSCGPHNPDCHHHTKCPHHPDCPHQSKTPKPTGPCTTSKPGHPHPPPSTGTTRRCLTSLTRLLPHNTGKPGHSGHPGQPTHVPVNSGHAVVASGLGLVFAAAAAYFLL
ncbi:hypothetical protein ACCO45_005793 [Purpureocillium lilacinum]|uniref:Uncharacterized protein n=1 Tax=Purpureocillium lilacinum TaxID=33203 RepID=A0ACC4DWF4_PURLI